MQGIPSAWQEGWHRQARRLDSPYFGARPAGACIDLVIVHSISLPPGQFGGQQVQELFTGQLDCSAHPYYEQLRGLQVSSHFYIRRNGELWQFVSCNDRAWHAGVSRYRGRDQCNDDSIGIELEGLEGGHFESAQYDVLATLCQELRQAYPVRHLAGHEHVAPGRKHDPGPGFDWSRLQALLDDTHWCFP